MMFDEIVRTEFKADGSVEVELANDDAQELECAVIDLKKSWRRWKEIDPAMATCGAQLGIEWWRAAEYLMLADSRLNRRRSLSWDSAADYASRAAA
jgi:hypothetical protein